jgi:phosphoribosylanthranilate isomerase
VEPVGHPRVKVCCIGSAHEARAAVRAGAAALGFVSRMPSGPGVIDEALIAEIVRCVPPGVGTFLLTSSQSANEIVV